MCQSISINEQPFLSPVYAIGFRGNAYQTPSGPIKTTISTNYFCEVTGDIPNKLVNQIKNYDFNSSPCVVSIAGKTGSAYLTKYSLSCSPNQAVIASADYDIYHELSGEFTRQNPNLIPSYNPSNASGIAHYWSSYIKSHDSLVTGALVSFNYSCSLNWLPIYTIGTGRHIPTEVKLMDGREEFSFSHENAVRGTYSGQAIESSIPAFHKIELYPASFAFGLFTTNKITLWLASGIIVGNRLDFQEDSVIMNETLINKYF
jgi:hypothetical protein